MSPTRRAFLATTGAVASAAVLLPGALPPGTPEPEPVVSTVTLHHGLPPTQRLQPMSCRECGDDFGEVLMDEFDDPSLVAICKSCYDDDVDEARGERTDDDLDLDGVRDQLSELEDKYDVLREHYDRIVATLDGLEWDLRDVETAVAVHDARLGRRLERLREVLDTRPRIAA